MPNNVSSPPVGLVHVATMLAVTDLDASVAFYRNLLGFEVRDLHSSAALLTRDTVLQYLVTHSPPTPDNPSVTLTAPATPAQTPVNLVFRVEDCRAAYEQLAALGVTFLTPLQQPPWGGWRCFARDPNGDLVEIEEPQTGP